jgi:hypothetical protein
MNKEKTIIEITECTWKQATDALQQILAFSSAESPPNDDEIISAACEQVRKVLAFEKHRKSEEDARKAHEIAMEESKHMIITSQYSTLQGRIHEGVNTNFDEEHMPEILRCNGVTHEAWNHLFQTSIGLFEKLRAEQGVMYSSGVEISGKEAYKSSLEIAIAVSNFTAYANCLLNPCGILVQLKKDVVHNLELEVPDAKTQMMRKAKNLLVLTIALSQMSVGASLPLASAVVM